MALSGTVATPVAWIGMVLFIVWLMWTKKLPMQEQINDQQAIQQ